MLIVGPNLTIDRTIRLPELRPGEVMRARSAEQDAGGKGVNVARLGKLLGRPTELVAFLPEGRTGEVVANWLADSGVALHAVPIAGEVRSAAIMLEDDGRITVLNEPGPAAGATDWTHLTAAVEERLPGHGVLVCSGSTPPDSPADAYAGLIPLAARHGTVSIVDATGPALGAALAAGPDLVTPNLAEAEDYLLGRAHHGVDAPTADLPARATAAARELVERGARAALVTVGRSGLALAQTEGNHWLDAAPVEVSNPIGAGDALVAGLASALEQGRRLEDAVRTGTAAAAASVEQELSGRLDQARVAELRARLEWGRSLD